METCSQGKFGRHKRGTLETDLQPTCRAYIEAKPAVGDSFEYFVPFQCERARFIRQHVNRSTVRVHQVVACPVIKSAVILLELNKRRCHDVLGRRISFVQRAYTHAAPHAPAVVPFEFNEDAIFVCSSQTNPNLQETNRSTKEQIKSL